MFKHMLLGLGAASLLVVVTAMPVQAGSSPLLGTPLDPSVIVTSGDWQWVWVSPCDSELVEGESNKCSFGDNHYGFRPPSEIDMPGRNPWTESFDDRSDLLSAFTMTAPSGGLSLRCATPYFSSDHGDSEIPCNDTEVGFGLIFGAPYPGFAADQASSTNPDAEVFWAQYKGTETPSLPEPSSLLLLGAGLLGLAAWRWKQRA